MASRGVSVDSRYCTVPLTPVGVARAAGWVWRLSIASLESVASRGICWDARGQLALRPGALHCADVALADRSQRTVPHSCCLAALFARLPLHSLLFSGPMFVRHAVKAAPGTRSIFTRRKLVSPTVQKLRNGFYASLTVGGLIFGTYYYLDSRAGIHTYATMPLVHAFTDPETSHNMAIKAMSWGITPKDPIIDDASLAFDLWGKHFSNPIGLAAGLDKQAEAVDGLFDLGFGYVEIGSVTPNAQPGNEKPRYFRLPLDGAVINRYGFNSDGHDAIALRLRDRVRHYLFHSRPSDAAAHQLAANPSGSTATDALSLPRSLRPGKVLAINLGKNKNGDEVEDYVKGVQKLGRFADVLVINVSSPNTPGLRDLQHGESLRKLLSAVVRERNQSNPTVPVCVKIAPDLSTSEIVSIAAAIKESKIDGCIISNTTISRPGSLTPVKTITEAGGLSGPPLKPLTMQALRTMRKEVGKSCVLIACGGVTTGKDVLDYGMAGASFVQGYTAFGYDGTRYPRRLKDELLEELGGRNWKDIIGSSV